MADYILRRKGNYFTKNLYEEVCGEGSFGRDIEANIITSASSNLYKGVPYKGFRQYRRVNKEYRDSGAAGYLNSAEPEKKITMTEARDLGIDIAQALTSGYIKLTREGLQYDKGDNLPKVIPNPSEGKNKTDQGMIARKENILSKAIVKHFNIPMKYLGPNLEGLINEPIYSLLSFENPNLLGVPYIMLDKLYTREISQIYITEENFDACMILIASGHVKVKKNKLVLDGHKLKEEKYWDWVGKYVFCHNI